MRKWLELALISCLMVVLVTAIYPNQMQRATAYDYSQRILHSHQGDSPVAAGAIAQVPTVPVTGERVTYGTVNNQPVSGYLARPADATTPLPALIVIHEAWGLNENIEMMTQRLAGEGYTALAVDLYNGAVAQNLDQARAQARAASQNPQQLEANLRQAYQYLEIEQQAPKIGSIGWCFGGSWSLNTALLFPNELDAAVIYYGGQLVTDPERLSSLEMPILGIFGALDDNPPVETVKQFEAALKSLNKPVEVHIYEGADHAFANPSGTRYKADAAADAWDKTVAFLERYLKQ
jgi:carboxymethylenebutenolidase